MGRGGPEVSTEGLKYESGMRSLMRVLISTIKDSK